MAAITSAQELVDRQIERHDPAEAIRTSFGDAVTADELRRMIRAAHQAMRAELEVAVAFAPACRAKAAVGGPLNPWRDFSTFMDMPDHGKSIDHILRRLDKDTKEARERAGQEWFERTLSLSWEEAQLADDYPQSPTDRFTDIVSTAGADATSELLTELTTEEHISRIPSTSAHRESHKVRPPAPPPPPRSSRN